MKKKISLLLAGGGVKAMSYLGFIKALEEAGIEIDVVGGFSGGALGAVLYAMDKPIEEIIKLSENTSLLQLFNRKIVKNRTLFGEDRVDSALESLIGKKTFEELDKKIYIFATNLTDKKVAYFDKGDIFSAVRASIAITPIIPSKIIKGKEYIDGGFLTLFPTSIMRKFTDYPIIGLLTNFKLFGTLHIMEKMPYLDLISENYMRLMLESDPPDLYFDSLPEDKGHLFSLGLTEYYYSEGYKAGKDAIQYILELKK